MSWQHWVLVSWFVLELLLAAGRIGKEREPVTDRDYIGYFLTYIAWGFLAVTG